MQAVTQADIIRSVEEVEIKLTDYKTNNKFLSPELYYYWKLERFSICRGVSHKSFNDARLFDYQWLFAKTPIH
ncbi:hypothetical protein HMPREF0548_0666 [Lactobacillus ultunensis DSM 16047]|uniref:Uncharacterized protein n=1 Tax=Lactobacillus ultunensis DSM 16047 TaxID=525365 RepID=C2ELX0_9LACO|nr:hypothetical protein HMPREF0548_0666 [Lactobacillus ultunensis DSM 16047]